MTRRCSVKPRELRDEHTVADSGDGRQKKLIKFPQLRVPLLDSFLQVGHQVTTELRGDLFYLGVASNAG
jgi:hypothetical protein